MLTVFLNRDIHAFENYLNIVILLLNSLIALGGVMLVENGKAKVHVFKPSLAKKPIQSEKDFEKILINFVEVSPPSVGLGCIVSHDPVISINNYYHTFLL